MSVLQKNPKLASLLQDTIIQILEKQPGLTSLNPEFLEAIAAPKPAMTSEDIENRVKHQILQEKMFKLKVDPPPTDQPAEPEYLVPLEDVGDIGDIFADMQLLERAGIGFGREEKLLIFLALKKLLHQNPNTVEGEKITRARLWGKIFGTKQDYLIAECVISDRKELPPLPPDLDPKKHLPPDGIAAEPGDFLATANHHVYYVCAAAAAPDWVRLDDVQPAQIVAARRLRRLFTGELNAPVAGGTPFPGREAAYLRAQIARITHACRVAPRGHLADTTDREGGGELTVGLSEEGTFFGMTGEQLCDLQRDAWVHAALDLLPQGRAQYHNFGWAPPDDKPEMKDPHLQKNRPVLQSIHLDTAPDLGAPAWSAHICGGLEPQYACAVVRSNVWPGACAVGWGYTFVNYYQGMGQMCTGRMFAPAALWPVPADKTLDEYKKGPRSRPDGVGGDLNLEPPPKPAEGDSSAP